MKEAQIFEFEVLQLAVSGFGHQMLGGADKEDYELTVFVKDKDTGDVLDNHDLVDELFEDG